VRVIHRGQAPASLVGQERQRRTAFSKIVLNEARLAWRRPVVQVASLGIPVVLVVLFGEMPAFHEHELSLGGLTLYDVYVPVLMAFALGLLALLGVPIPLVSHRQLEVLRRLSRTPVPPPWLLAAQGVVQLCVALAGLVVIEVVAVAAFGTPAPKSPAGLALSRGLSIVGLLPMGLTIAAISRTAAGASVIGRLAFFPLMFFAGLWLPRAMMPDVLADISNYTPLGAAAQAMQDSMLQGFPPVAPLLVLAGYALAFGFLAKRFFRWE
jgi:ABC-2 type transport system permease protein